MACYHQTNTSASLAGPACFAARRRNSDQLLEHAHRSPSKILACRVESMPENYVQLAAAPSAEALVSRPHMKDMRVTWAMLQQPQQASPSQTGQVPQETSRAVKDYKDLQIFEIRPQRLQQLMSAMR